MAQYSSQSISRDKFLTMAANLLYRSLLESSRTDAKKVFRDIAEGREVHLSDVRMEDESLVRFNLALDHSELQQRLNYGAFRASLATLVHNLGETLKQEDQQITVFTAEANPDMNIFGVTAVTYEGEAPRVMVLASDAGTGRASILLKLMYLNPEQFSPQASQA